MSERPITLVDMDGVVANFHLGVISAIKDEMPDVDTHRTYSHFYIADDYPEIIDLARDISNRPDFFSSLKVIEGAVEGWHELLEAGYHPRICSSPLKSHPNSKNEKLQWLDTHFVPHFGQQVVDEAYIVNDKTNCQAIALIDDKPKITGNYVPMWQQIMFTQSYNVAVNTEHRINNWHDDRLIPMLGRIATEYN